METSSFRVELKSISIAAGDDYHLHEFFQIQGYPKSFS